MKRKNEQLINFRILGSMFVAVMLLFVTQIDAQQYAKSLTEVDAGIPLDPDHAKFADYTPNTLNIVTGMYTDRALFEAAIAAFDTEDFENPTVGANAVVGCARPLDEFTSSCYDPGELIPGFSLEDFPDPAPNPPNALVIVTPTRFQTTSVIIAPNTFTQNLEINFPNNITTAFGFDFDDKLNAGVGTPGMTYVIEIYGQNGLIDNPTHTATAANGRVNFFGVTTDEPIVRVVIDGPGRALETIDNLVFGQVDLIINADVCGIVCPPDQINTLLPGECEHFVTIPPATVLNPDVCEHQNTIMYSNENLQTTGNVTPWEVASGFATTTPVAFDYSLPGPIGKPHDDDMVTVTVFVYGDVDLCSSFTATTEGVRVNTAAGVEYLALPGIIAQPYSCLVSALDSYTGTQCRADVMSGNPPDIAIRFRMDFATFLSSGMGTYNNLTRGGTIDMVVDPVFLEIEPGLCGAINGVEAQITINAPVRATNDSPNANEPYENASGYYPPGVYEIEFCVKNLALEDTCCTMVLTVDSFPNAITALACNDNVQISLDENCEVTVGADLILEGGPYGCYDDYIVEVTDAQGRVIDHDRTLPGTQLGHSEIGKCYTVRVTDPNTGNSCWGELCVEDKLPPVVTSCPDVTLACDDNTSPVSRGGSALDPTYADGCGVSARYVDWTDDGTCALGYDRRITRTWTFTDWAGNTATCVQTITVEFANLFDVRVPHNYDGLDRQMLLCDEAYDEVLDAKIDPTKEEVRPGVENPHFPAHDVDVTNGCFIGCVDDYILDTVLYNQNCRWRFPRVLGWNTIKTGQYAGHPSPHGINYRSHWQWVRTRGRRCFGGFPTDDPQAFSGWVKWLGTGTPTGATCSNLEFIFEDRIFDLANGNCDAGDIGCYKVLRQWTVYDWCASQVGGYNQLIKVVDNKGPEVQYPDYLEVGMNSWECSGRWVVPAPWMTDNCSNDIHYTVEVKDAIVRGNEVNGYLVLGLSKGHHLARIIAYDCCGNKTVHEIDLNVIDDVPPTPVCDSHTTVSLTNSNDPSLAFVKIYAKTFDDGSHDNCSEEIWFKVIRMDELLGTAHGSLADNRVACSGIDGDDDGILPGNQIYFDNFVKFCCADVGQSIMVVFRVFDVNPGGGAVHPSRMQRTGDLVGHYSDCMVEVEVQNKAFPIVVAPDDVAVSCMFWFDDSEDALSDPNNPTFGRIVTSLSARTKLKTTDLACEAWCEDHNYSYLRWFPKGRAPQFVPSPAVSELACQYASKYYNSTHPDFKYSFVWGWEGYVSQTCGVVPEIRVNDRRECGQGLITRDIIVTVNGVRYQDRQEIWVVDCDPFEINPELCRDNTDDIEWPLNCSQPRAFDGCGADLSPDNPRVGKPEIVGDADDNCALISIDYKDDTITIEKDACFKVIRDWRVVDWCHFDITEVAEDANGDAYGYVHPHPGEWHYQQILKVRDKIDPVVTCSAGDCEPGKVVDTVIIIGNPSTCHGHIELEVEATDDCTPDFWLTYDYKIDINNDRLGKYGTYDVYVGKAHPGEEAVDFFNPYADDEKNPQNASGYYPLGQHMIQYYVEDGCGNVAVCTTIFDVIDCKAPTPYCETGIITVVMPSNGSITIWASDLDAGSFDNCTAQEDLKLYFNGNPSDTGFVVNCDTFVNRGANDKVLIEVELWVEDEAGNTDYCITTIEVQDNNDTCDDTGSTPALKGSVTSANATIELTKSTSMRLDQGGNMMEEQMAAIEGAYKFNYNSFNQNDTYTVTATNNVDPLNNVSTRDLIAIQKHLLGKAEFKNAYQYIAADVNNNSNVSTADISALRKVILGKASDFTGYRGQQSWRLILKGSVSKDMRNDEVFSNMKEEWSRNDVKGAIINWVAVKIGDLGNYSNVGGVSTRSAGTLTMEAISEELVSGDEYRMEMSSSNFEQIEGYQYTMTYDASSLEFVGVESGVLAMTESNLGLTNEGVITVSWNAATGVDVSANKSLYTMIFKAKTSVNVSKAISINSNVINAEAYSGNEDRAISLNFRGVNEAFVLHQNVPNPFKSITTISFELPRAIGATLSVYDVDGKVLKVVEVEGTKGMNQITLKKSELSATGVLYYQLDAADYTATKRMVLMK